MTRPASLQAVASYRVHCTDTDRPELDSHYSQLLQIMIFATLPVTTATGERGFRCTKYISKIHLSFHDGPGASQRRV